MMSSVLRVGADLLSLAQVLLYLPLTLDIAEPGKEAMRASPSSSSSSSSRTPDPADAHPQPNQPAVALSLMLTVSFGISATLHLAVRNTKLRPLSTILSWLSPLLIPALLLLTLNLYSTSTASAVHPSLRDKVLHPHLLAAAASAHPSTSPSSSSSTLYDSLVSFARAAPSAWETVLRKSSPVFTILEGLCTLLCIQAVSRFTVARIDDSRSPDLLKMLVLIVAAGIYVISAYFLWEVRPLFSPELLQHDARSCTDPCSPSRPQSYGTVTDRLSSTFIGVAVTTILFLSGISFSVQKGNVIETALMLACVPSRCSLYLGRRARPASRAPPFMSGALGLTLSVSVRSYAVFQIFHLSNRPQMYTAGLLKHVFKAPGTNGHPPLPPVVLQSCVLVSLCPSEEGVESSRGRR